MLTDKKIIDVINNLEKEHVSDRDNGSSFFETLAKKIINTIDSEQKIVIDFLLNEIKNNQNGRWWTALETIKAMNAVELCPRIVDIYNEVGQEKDAIWKECVIETLMKMQYTPACQLYLDYIVGQKKQNKNIYFLLVMYCNVDLNNALPLLSDYLIENIERTKIGEIIENRIGFLIYDCYKNPVDYMPELLNKVSFANKETGQYLKCFIIDFLNSENAKQSISKSWIENTIMTLENCSTPAQDG